MLTAEDGAIVVGEECVVMEHALVRGRAGHPVEIGDHVLIGPHAHVNGATIGDEAFIATGASVFPGASVGTGAEVRINGVVQVNTRLEPGAVVPISWVAVGTPAQLFSPDRHEEIWAIQQALDFVGTVYGSRPRRRHGRDHAPPVGVLRRARLGPDRRLVDPVPLVRVTRCTSPASSTRLDVPVFASRCETCVLTVFSLIIRVRAISA